MHLPCLNYLLEVLPKLVILILMQFLIPFIFFLAIFIPSCAPTIQVSTPEPVKIDVNMRVDVHTKDDRDKSVKKEAATEETPLASRRRSRMGEIQDMKNSHFIGENRSGYIEIRQKPEGKIASGESYADYIQRIVREENNDRRALYLQTAEKEGVPMEITEREMAKRWYEISYPKEWLQKEDSSWYQK